MPSVVLDASAVVALLVARGRHGDWVAEQSAGHVLAAPALVTFEVANVLRRHELNGTLHESQAALAHDDLVAMPVQLWPYRALADRVWRLRGSITAYDASYVALAELLDAPLLTLDRRLGRAAGIGCEVRLP